MNLPDLRSAYRTLTIILFISVPLATWKMVDLAFWVKNRVSITVKLKP